jgi:hypothetical protein
MYIDEIDPVYSTFSKPLSSSPPFNSFSYFVTLFSYTHIMYFNHIHPSPTPFPIPSPTGSPQIVPLLQSRIIIIIVMSRVYLWMKMWCLSFWIWLISRDIFQFHSFSCKRHKFFLLYGWIILRVYGSTFSLSVHWFLGSWIDFSSLAIMNSGTIHMDVQIIAIVCWLSFLLIYVQVVWQDHMVGLILISWGPSIMISIIAA